VPQHTAASLIQHTSAGRPSAATSRLATAPISRDAAWRSAERTPLREMRRPRVRVAIKTGSGVETWTSTGSHQMQAMRRGQTGTHPVEATEEEVRSQRGRSMTSTPCVPHLMT